MKFPRMLSLLLALFVTGAAGCSESKQVTNQRGAPQADQQVPAGSADKPAPEAAGPTITMNYTLTVDGEVVDGSEGKEPLQLTLGSGQIMPAFEKAVAGLKAGDKKSFTLSAEEGFGARIPEQVQSVPRTQLPKDMTPEPGMVVQAKSPEGQVRNVTILEVKDDVVVMDFNHPLAGKSLNFDVEVLEVK